MNASLPPVTSEFRTFIQGLLRFGGLKKANLESYTDDQAMKDFRMAFTHKSYSSEFNYERLEFLGDLTLNWCVGNYIHDHYPRIINVDWLTRMKHALVSKKSLGIMAANHGFFKHIVYSEEVKEALASEPDIKQSQLYKDMMEDTVEAFLGALKTVSDRKKSMGVSMALAYNIVSRFLDSLNIKPYDYTEYYDPVSQLKEIHDKYHWNFTEAMRFRQNVETGEYTAIVFAYPKGNQQPLPENSVRYQVVSLNKKDAKCEVAAQALQKLAENYNIRAKIPDPFKKNAWKLKPRRSGQTS